MNNTMTTFDMTDTSRYGILVATAWGQEFVVYSDTLDGITNYSRLQTQQGRSWEIFMVPSGARISWS